MLSGTKMVAMVIRKSERLIRGKCSKTSPTVLIATLKKLGQENISDEFQWERLDYSRQSYLPLNEENIFP